MTERSIFSGMTRMQRIFNTYFTTDYLFTVVTGGKYERFYLYFPLALLAITLIARAYLFIKGNRPPVLKTFDRLWFWGGIVFSFLGLFIWFSRNQSLPMFSSRIVSYAWILIMILYAGYLFYFWKKKIPAELSKYYEKKRKTKYLR